MPAWTPSTEGTDYELTPILKPLEKLRSELLVISGLSNLPGRPDGAGDHDPRSVRVIHTLFHGTVRRMAAVCAILAGASLLGAGFIYRAVQLCLDEKSGAPMATTIMSKRLNGTGRRPGFPGPSSCG